MQFGTAPVITILRTVDLPVLPIAGLGLIGTPASAHVISGGWVDNHVICNGCTYRTGNIVRLWQSLLWSANVSGASSNCNNWLDGIFGPATEE